LRLGDVGDLSPRAVQRPDLVVVGVDEEVFLAEIELLEGVAAGIEIAAPAQGKTVGGDRLGQLARRGGGASISGAA
jgi:hypothetical protein